MRKSTARYAAPLLAAAVFAAGCASDRPGRVVQADSPSARACPLGETLSCVERMGEVQRCFCADKDTMRDLLEPVTTY